MPFGFKFQGEADETPAFVRATAVGNRGRRDCSDLDRSRDIMAGVSYAVAFSPSRYCGCGGIRRQRSHSATWNHRADRIPEAKQQVGSQLLSQRARNRPERPNIEFL
jgi:hypothetical protein